MAVMNKLRLFGVVTAAVLVIGALAACGGGVAASVTEVTPATVAVSVTEAAATEVSAPVEAANSDNSAAEVTTPAMNKLNLNTVTADELLATIPDFSRRMTREFAEYRPYVSILQFRREIGKYVSAEQVAAWEAYVYVPVDANNADAATLMQLPGVSEAIGASLIDGRPYADNAAFLAALAGYVSVEDAAAAGAYLTVP